MATSLLLISPLSSWLARLELSTLTEALRNIQDTLQSLVNSLAEVTAAPATPSPALVAAVRAGLLALGAVAMTLGIAWSVRVSHRRRAAWWAAEQSPLRPGARSSFLERVQRRAGQVRPPHLLAAASIRRIYANTTRLAARRGYPRRLAETPNEYLPRLIEALPGCADKVRAITAAYVLAHYGEVEDTHRRWLPFAGPGDGCGQQRSGIRPAAQRAGPLFLPVPVAQQPPATSDHPRRQQGQSGGCRHRLGLHPR